MDILDINCLAQLNKSSCRLCLAAESNTSEPSSQTQHLVLKLTDLVISELDFLTTICRDCTSTLIKFGEFRRKCHKINEFLFSHSYCQSRLHPEVSPGAENEGEPPETIESEPDL
jgi:Zinc-finger associated domain (zf-AD)